MAPADLRLVRVITRRLTSALEQRKPSRADKQIDRIMVAALRSPRRFEVTFAAVQMLRDLGEIDRSEAAYLFNYLLDLVQWGDRDTDEPWLDELARDLPETTELMLAAISHRDQVEADAFYRSRGEYELADLLSRHDDAYSLLVAEGRLAIFDPKEYARDLPADERSTNSQALVEKVLALSSSESQQEWLQSWLALFDSTREVTPATVVRAVQEAREIGAISFDDSLCFIADAIDDLVWDECHADRRYTRLERRRDALDASLDIKSETPLDQQPFEYRMVEAELRRRWDALAAVMLRESGEHRMANLLMNDPKEYDRLRVFA